MGAGRVPPGRVRLGQLIDQRRQELGLTWTEVAERAGLTYAGLRLIRKTTSELQKDSKDGIELALEWEPGSVDAILADGMPTPLEAGGSARPDDARPDPDESAFDDAFAGYRKALGRLRRAAAADPDVDPEAREVIEDLNLIAHAMIYGGAPGARKAVIDVAESYKREALGENGSHRSA